MKKTKLNQNWQFLKGCASSLRMLQMEGKFIETICLPHDAMISEKRTPDTKNQSHTGFYPGGIYTYFKYIDVPEDWEEKTAVLEFEGVYQTAMVYVNGALAATNLYGYTNFYVTLDPFLKYGQQNEIKVVADNSVEENSRWYSGSGIYRNVNLYLGENIHIPQNGVRITTVDADPDLAVVEVKTKVKNLGRRTENLQLSLVVNTSGNTVASDCIPVTVYGGEETEIKQRIMIQKPHLWNCSTPNMYECIVNLENSGIQIDETVEGFGIRKLQLDTVHGLRINGETVKLKGTCIHHDNGILGAAAFEEAERRKCHLIKEAGFNSIRSSHHPASKAMLDACDREGILVMDELFDMWNTHKNNHDFALHFAASYPRIIEAMVEKDYNHPCVILYSTGNEIPEMGTKYGAKISRDMSNRIASLDSTRYTTNGINGLMAAGSSILEIMKDVMPLIEKKEGKADTADETGSNALNSFMEMMTGKAGDAFSTHPLLTEAIAESSATLDVIGLNYLTGRHVLEKKLHPNQCIVGTETFPADIVRLWSLVKENPHILGDFTWTGYDYLGEAGCGIFYYDGKQNFGSFYPDRLSYIGDINLVGYRRPISYLREIVYGDRTTPYIAVERVDRYGMKHSKSPWMFKDNIASWTWHGLEGRPAIVDVYCAEEEVELFLNGKSCGRKAAGEKNGFTATYEILYEPGTLTAKGYRQGKERETYTIKTAGRSKRICLEIDKEKLKADGEDMAFLRISFTDEEGEVNLYESNELRISVVGEGRLQGFGNANPSSEESYTMEQSTTYDGYAMAVLRSSLEPGSMKVTVSAEGYESETVTLRTVAVE